MSGSISDLALSLGSVVHVDTLHGESVKVLTGQDAGRTFSAVRENEADIVFDGDLGADPRGRRMLRFRADLPTPNIDSQDKIQTSDGLIWNAVKRPDSAYLTVDFELTQVVQGKDK